MPPRQRKPAAELSTIPNSVRARLRKRKATDTEGIKADAAALYGKPIDEWDLEELARGYPRGPDGKFPTGRRPPAAVLGVTAHELSRRLKTETRRELSSHIHTALSTLAGLMTDERTDEDGRPLVPASVKADVAKYVTDQLIGKAKISVDIDAPSVMEFFQQRFSGGLVNRDGSAYRPVRGQAQHSLTAGDPDQDDDAEPLPDDEGEGIVVTRSQWEADRPTHSNASAAAQQSVTTAQQPSVAGDDSPPDWVSARHRSRR